MLRPADAVKISSRREEVERCVKERTRWNNPSLVVASDELVSHVSCIIFHQYYVTWKHTRLIKIIGVLNIRWSWTIDKTSHDS